MHTVTKWTMGLALIALSIAAHAQETTLDYQGSVFTDVNLSGNYISAGVPVLSSLMGDIVLSAPAWRPISAVM